MDVTSVIHLWQILVSVIAFAIFCTIADAQTVIRKQLRENVPINVTSPEYPNHYPNSQGISWHIAAPSGFRILAKLGSLSLERSKDYLRFGDAYGDELIQLTGRYSPPSIISPASVMWIKFTSDASSTDTGFQFEVSTFNHSEVRLADGTTPLNGRVEVFSQIYGWSTVSDNEWNLKGATTVCKELGLPGATKAVSNALYGAGRGTVLMTQVDCSNDNFRLKDCSYLSPCLGCSHSQDAGVICHRPNYVGCFSLPSISGSSTSGSSVEKCIVKCDQSRMQYAALNGNRCYCRSSITFPETPEDDTSCDRPCSGNPNDVCGGQSDSVVFSVYDTKFATCEDPGTPHNATRKGNSFQFGSKVTFNCSAGFQIIGDWELKCVAGDSLQEPKWNYKVPVCLALVDNSTQTMNTTLIALEQASNYNTIIIIAVVLAVIFSILFLILLIFCILRCWRRGRCRRKPTKMDMWY